MVAAVVPLVVEDVVLRPLLVVEIPGEPVAQGRPKAARVRTRDGREILTLRDPTKSRTWKHTAQSYLAAAMAGARPFAGPLAAVMVFRFTLPRSRWKKRAPLERSWKPGRPDADNAWKILADACQGIAFLDDAQLCDVRVLKHYGAQGEAPGVGLALYGLDGVPVPACVPVELVRAAALAEAG